MGIAESCDFELRYPSLCPHYRMGRPIRHYSKVRLDAVRQEMMGSRAFTTVSARLVWTYRRPGNLTRYRSKDQVSFKSDAAFPDRFPRDHKRREPRLQIGRTPTENFAVSNGALRSLSGSSSLQNILSSSVPV